MPITTYRSSPPDDKFLDDDMKELLDEVRKKTKRQIFIQRYDHPVHENIWIQRWTGNKMYSKYEILIPILGDEYQVLNFGDENMSCNNDKIIVMAYLYGCLFNT